MAEEKNTSSKVPSGPPSNEATCAVAPPSMNINADRLVKYTRDNKGRFVTPWLKTDATPKPSRATALKFYMRWDGTSQVPSCQRELDKTLPILKPDFDLLSQPVKNGIRTTWIGHATVLVQMGNITVLTDPIFSQRASMLQWAGPKRYRSPPCTIEELPKIDAVVISHTHYDHLDYNSVKALNRRFGADLAWFVPLGNETWMKDAGCEQVYALDWWQEQIFSANGSDVKFVFTPTKHWSQRSLIDKCKVLWGSWCLIEEHNRFFFAGDTGYCNAFQQIGEEYGPFDLAAIPIAAYEPRDMMAEVHLNPAEAVQVHQDVRAKKSLAIHWGTFKLTFEPYLEPPAKVKEVMLEKGLQEEDFFVLSHGETRQIENIHA